MRRLFVLSALAACGGDGAEGPVGAISAHVTHYDYRFDIESRAAHATVTARVDTEGDCLTLPFRANDFDPATAKIDGKKAVSGTIEPTTMTLCGDGHAAGETITIDADMTIPLETVATSQVGYSITNDAEGNPFYYLVSWVGGCDKFGPCDSRPDQFATYTFHVTHPETLMVSCPGTITETSAIETLCDFDLPGGPTYSTFGVAAYPRAAWPSADKGMWGSVHVTVYDRPGTHITAAIDPAYHAGFVGWMESTFGPYPFGTELRVLTAPTYWSGFEHPGNIVLDDGLAKVVQPAYLHNVQHILDHEIAHMWAGDQTTIADTYDFVWKESMAEYLSFSFEAMMDPPAANKTAAAWKNFAAAAAYFPVPGEHPALFAYYGDVYGAGPMVLFRQLEVLTSRAKVIEALQSVLGRAHAISVDEVIEALQAKTGLDLSAYSAAWIHGSGKPVWPTINTTFTAGAGTSTLAVHQTLAQDRRCKFHVLLGGANPGEVVQVEVDTFRNGIDQEIQLPTPAFAVTVTQLDPFSECLVFPGTLARPIERAHPWRTARGAAADHAAAR